MRFSIDLGDAPIWKSSLALGIAVRFMLLASLTINCWVLRINRRMHRKSGGRVPLIPPLYSAGIRYKEEPKDWDIEHFDTIPVLYKPRRDGKLWGDCDDLAPALAAELIVSGQDKRAGVAVRWLKNPPGGRRLYHVLVRRKNVPRSRIDGHRFLSDDRGGVLEDPCRVLGMGRES